MKTATRPTRPKDPCPYPPGSPQKLDVLARRAAARQPLFHPADAAGEAGGWAARLAELTARGRARD